MEHQHPTRPLRDLRWRKQEGPATCASVSQGQTRTPVPHRRGPPWPLLSALPTAAKSGSFSPGTEGGSLLRFAGSKLTHLQRAQMHSIAQKIKFKKTMIELFLKCVLYNVQYRVEPMIISPHYLALGWSDCVHFLVLFPVFIRCFRGNISY